MNNLHNIIISVFLVFAALEVLVASQKVAKTKLPALVKSTKEPKKFTKEPKKLTKEPKKTKEPKGNKKTKEPKADKKVKNAPTPTAPAPLSYATCTTTGFPGDCPTGSMCATAGGGTFCYGLCATTADCTTYFGRTGYVCDFPGVVSKLGKIEVFLSRGWLIISSKISSFDFCQCYIDCAASGGTCPTGFLCTGGSGLNRVCY